jgi:hydroxyacyl-ACP dehydratase HTD2-like protein with hotdog domain
MDRELQEVMTRAAARLGQAEEQWLGTVSVRDFCHYATAVRDDAYVAAAVAAQRRGEPVEAPPLFASGIFSWSHGPAETELHPSGLDRGGSPCTDGLPVRQVHGGQSVTVDGPLRAGDELVRRRVITGAEAKRGRSGEFVVLTITNEIRTAGGQPVCSGEERIIVRAGAS